MTQNEFPFINVPPKALPIVGGPTPGTRFYRREGSDEEYGEWIEAIGRFFQGDVGLSPGGVAMFVPVSRAAVHKRLREGRLTGFAFYVTSQGKSLWGKPRKIKERPYLVLSVSECKAWVKELKRKAAVAEEAELTPEQRRQLLGPVAVTDEPETRKEVEADDKFIEQDPKDKRRKDVVYGEPISRAEMSLDIQREVRMAMEEVLGAVLPGKLGEKHRKRLRHGVLMYDYKLKKWSWEKGILARKLK
jgi:hypothetical protein